MEKFNRYVVVSTNNNPDYYFYFPYIEKAWNSYGWEVCCMVTKDFPKRKLKKNNPNTVIIKLPNIPELRTETIAQASRLYASNYLPLDAMIMTSDMDLLPLSNYWNPVDGINVYGYDLTWRTQYPIGYIAMTGNMWKQIMNLNGNTAIEMLRDANETKVAFSDKWEDWWSFDQHLITQRLKPIENSINFVDRGQINIAGTTLALGRVDRYNWEVTKKEQPKWIDAHCENNNTQHPDKLNKFLEVFEQVHGKL